MLNQVTLLGRLGSDPEVRETASGKAVANFSLATDETFVKDGEKQKRTEWHRLVLWDKLAGIAEKYLHKGDLIAVNGKIQSRQYEDSSGVKKTVVEIIVNNMRMISTGERAEAPAAKAKPAARAATAVADDTDDVGF